MQAHKTEAVVAEDGSVTLRDVPFEKGESLEVLLLQKPEKRGDAPNKQEATAKKGSAADLARSPLAGLWKDRDDIGDSLEYARKLRREAERRGDREKP